MAVEIITEGYPDDNQVLMDEISIKYYQPSDCTEDRDTDGQEIILSSRDGGGGKFINIKTDNWSISGIEDLKVLINDFNKRAGIKDESFSNS